MRGEGGTLVSSSSSRNGRDKTSKKGQKERKKNDNRRGSQCMDSQTRRRGIKSCHHPPFRRTTVLQVVVVARRLDTNIQEGKEGIKKGKDRKKTRNRWISDGMIDKSKTYGGGWRKGRLAGPASRTLDSAAAGPYR